MTMQGRRDVKIELQLSLPREARFVPTLRTTAGRFLVDLGVPRQDIEDVEIILTEACANVIRHAIDTSDYSVHVTVGAMGCTIMVRDEGPGFDLSDVGETRVTSESGRGLALISALADDVSVRHVEGEHTVLLEKTWADPLVANDL